MLLRSFQLVFGALLVLQGCIALPTPDNVSGLLADKEARSVMKGTDLLSYEPDKETRDVISA